VPLVILAFLAVFSGYLNAAPFGTEYFTEWVEPAGVVVVEHVDEAHAGEEGDAVGAFGGFTAPRPTAEEVEPTGCGFEAPADGVCYAPELSHAEFTWAKALPSILLVAFGALASLWLCLGIWGGRKNPFAGLTERNKVARAGHQFLVNKYYLDDLYEKVIVHGIAHPIAKAAYWVNQNVIDGIVNGVGRAGKETGEWVYRNVDQRVVDGAVNASGTAASETGHALQPVQSGKVNQYGALLFGAAAVGAIVLVLLNV
jgi:NADH-quinone oxidoreductase subunit L